MRSLQSPLILYHCAFPWQDAVAHVYVYPMEDRFLVRISRELFRNDIALSSEEATLKDAIEKADASVRSHAWLPQREIDSLLEASKTIHEVAEDA